MADAPAAPAAETPEPGFKAPEVAKPPTIEHADTGYNEQVAKIEFQLGNQLSGDKNTFEDNRKVYEYNKSLLPAKEHEETGIQRFRAATGGWSNSGFEARGQGRLQAKFLDTRTKMATAYGLKQQGINTRAQEQVGRRGIGLKEAGTGAEGRYFKEQNRNKPQTVEPPQPPPPPAPAPQQPIEIISERPQPRSGGARRAAANKARKR